MDKNSNWFYKYVAFLMVTWLKRADQLFGFVLFQEHLL